MALDPLDTLPEPDLSPEPPDSLLASIPEVVDNIRSIAEFIVPEDDHRTIDAIHDQIDEDEAERREVLEQAHADLKALARVLDAARTSSTRPPNVSSAEKHAQNLNHLDAARLSFAKALNDAESAIASKQAEVSQLMEELRQLEESDPAAEEELDGRPLRLRIFRGLGVEAILDEDGNPDRVLLESPSHDMHVVKLGETQDEDPQVMERVWRLCS
jgi:kinetochore protein Spc24